MIYKPHNYQKKGIQHLLDNKGAGLLAQVGLGKSSMTLSAIEILINSLQTNKVLIVAPKRVTSHTWKAELEKWDHLRSLSMSRVIGTEKQRILALNTQADIYTISRDNIAWLVHYAIKQWRRWPFDMLVIDESSNFKNPSSMRFKAVKKVAAKTERVVILTGTFMPKHLMDAWGQVFLLDQGQRLGQTLSAYRDKYFTPGARNGHVIFNYEPKAGAEQAIATAIGDICLSMKTEDYLDLPERFDIYEEVELESHERYQEFKKNEVLTLQNGDILTPVNAAAFYGKLLQYCNGAIYKEDGSYEVVDNSKLDALCEDVESLNGDPVLIGYQFKSDYERIMQRIPHAIKLDSDEKFDLWNRGLIEVAITQVQSIAYGLNLQEGGLHIYQFGLGWDREIYEQFIGRVHRQGVRGEVIHKMFVAKDSVEQIVIERIFKKGVNQDWMMEALKRHLL